MRPAPVKQSPRPFVSVIIPTYNRAERLRGTVESFVAQQYPSDRFEIILVDNASTDDTPAEIERLATEFPRIRGLVENRRGAHWARNAGATVSLGEILYFTDDDMLAAMARELVEKNGIGESADAVWRSLHAEHQKLFPATSDRKYDDSSAADQCDREGAALTQPVEGDLDSALIAVPDRQSVLLPWKRRRSRAAIPEQGSLFG